MFTVRLPMMVTARRWWPVRDDQDGDRLMTRNGTAPNTTRETHDCTAQTAYIPPSCPPTNPGFQLQRFEQKDWKIIETTQDLVPSIWKGDSVSLELIGTVVLYRHNTPRDYLGIMLCLFFSNCKGWSFAGSERRSISYGAALQRRLPDASTSPAIYQMLPLHWLPLLTSTSARITITSLSDVLH